MNLKNSLLATAALLMSAVAPGIQAYTPESGIWWNPNEPGTGLVLEVQDNILALSGYVFDASGRSTWFLAAAPLSDNALVFDAALDGYQGGQCIGCAWPGAPTQLPAAAGRVRVVFDPDDQTRAQLSWGGRTVPIVRFVFAGKRGTDPAAASAEVTAMLGEWQVVTDYGDLFDFPFYGDVLVFDALEAASSGTLFVGCRADTTTDGFCSDDALDFAGAAGFYDPDSDLHFVVVDEGTDSSGIDVCLLYVVAVDIQAFAGGAEFYDCGDDPVYDLPYATRGFRTASRTFVERGVGPSKAVLADVRPAVLGTVATRSPRLGSQRLAAMKQTASDPSPLVAAVSPDRRASILRALESRLGH